MQREKNIFIEDEIKSAYLDYSMSVIVGRALPDARDGLKPVHRRILTAMNELGLQHTKPFKKSARITGDVTGKYHPHGEDAVYYAMVRMAQEFSFRYPLVKGQGNFGSIDGDSPAARRYTEAKLSKLASEMILDIDKNTVKFNKNYDNTLEEPSVMPSKFPNLILNGSSGIAVGMATNIPPHNFGEIADAVLATIKNREISAEELNEIVKGPDFPTGGIIFGKDGILNAYRTGRGKIRIRGKVSIEDEGKRESIIVTELPYQVNKAELVKSIADLVKDKKIEGISDLRDESDRSGMRIYIQLKRGEEPEPILNQLYKYTNLEVSFGIITLALVNNVPKVLSLNQVINHHLDHRFEVITKRTEFDLDKAERRLHILEGFRIATSNIDEVVKLIKGAKDVEEAKAKLMAKFNLTEIQSKAILEMRLQKLTGMEITKLMEEIAALNVEVANFRKILGDKNEIYKIIEEETTELKNSYSDKRRTEIVASTKEITMEDLVKDEEVLFTLTKKGYVKRQALEAYKAQQLGGKGYTGQGIAEDDFIKSVHMLKNLDTLLIFTNKGKVHSMRVYEVPELSRNSKGRLLSNLINLSEDEKVQSIIRVREMEESDYVYFVTKKGLVKRTALSLFKNINKSGIIAIKLKDKDDLINSFIANEDADLFVATRKGYAIKFNGKDIRPSGRSSMGVKGISLRSGDSVVSGISLPSENTTILTIASNGYGKRSLSKAYKSIKRGGKGVINMKLSEKTGNVVLVEEIKKNDGIVFITSKGSMVRSQADKVGTTGRATQGVRVMKMRKDEQVVDATKVPIEAIEN